MLDLVPQLCQIIVDQNLPIFHLNFYHFRLFGTQAEANVPLYLTVAWLTYTQLIETAIHS